MKIRVGRYYDATFTGNYGYFYFFKAVAKGKIKGKMRFLCHKCKSNGEPYPGSEAWFTERGRAFTGYGMFRLIKETPL